ncbi:hypothetical protein ABI125_12145 [Tamlana crocina]
MEIQRISDLQGRLSLFPPSEDYDLFYARFLEGNLGKIHQAIPWDDLVLQFKVKEQKLGNSMLFGPRGRLAPMFLKHYAGCSDRKLMEQILSLNYKNITILILLPNITAE